jgi:multiple antibiotic resistance protein
MQNWAQSFVFTFVPLFIVIDAIGNLPFVITFSEGMSTKERRKMIHIATATAVIVGLAFLFFGQLILKSLDISFGSFAIAGGIVLLVLSIKYMITGHMVEAYKEEMIAIVPIGTPLLVGPATITTLLLLASQFPLYMVLFSFIFNMFFAWVIFLLNSQIVRFIGKGGLNAISRVFSLLLAAISVSMILKGFSLLGVLNLPK